MTTKNASVHTDVQLSYRDVQLLQEMYSYYLEMYSYCLEMYSYYRCTAITENVKLFYRDDYKERTVHTDVQLLHRDIQLLQEMYSYYKRCTAIT